MSLIIINQREVRANFQYQDAMPAIRQAMTALSAGTTRQLPRGIIDLDNGRAFGVMAGALGTNASFGAKVISVFPENFSLGKQSHQGGILLFNPDDGAPIAFIHAGEVTAIRTAVASAIATDALARPDAETLLVLGYGEQAYHHVLALSAVRPLRSVMLWGRSRDRAQPCIDKLSTKLDVEIIFTDDVSNAARSADIICTTTAAEKPILFGKDLADGCHVNLVGSSRAGPAEADNDVVLRSRYFVDHKPAVLQAGAEFIHAKNAGLIDDDKILGEIGEVLSGSVPGRMTPLDITVYKSLGNIVQDIASAWFLLEKARQQGFGCLVEF